MRRDKQSGFSLVELLVVCAVIGIIATIAIPYLRKAVHATEARSMRTTLKAVSSTQLSFATTNNRYARLSEVNNLMGGGVGTSMGSDIVRNQFIVTMVPAAPTDAELREGYTITATRDVPGEGLHVYEVTQVGRVRQVLPACTGDCD